MTKRKQSTHRPAAQVMRDDIERKRRQIGEDAVMPILGGEMARVADCWNAAHGTPGRPHSMLSDGAQHVVLVVPAAASVSDRRAAVLWLAQQCGLVAIVEAAH